MPFDRPSLRTLVDRFRADIREKTEGGDALLRRSVESVLARVVPGHTHGLHGHIAWAAQQILPSACEEAQLLRWARLLGMALKAAVPATGQGQFASDGTLLPIGHLVQRADGVRYTVTAVTTLVFGGNTTLLVDLEAEDPGDVGNADLGTVLTLVSPVAGVTSTGEVLTEITGGEDVEDIEELRVRILQRLANPPRGGGPGDYVAWALEVPGVTRAWETPRVDGAGTVGVQFVTDDPDDVDATPIPDGAKVTTVADYIGERAPVTAGRSIDGEWVGVIVTAPTAHEIDPEIQVVPDTAEVRAAVKAELVDFLRREAEPGLLIRLSRFAEAISGAQGETSHVLVSPVVDIAPAAGHLPVLGTITWS